MIPESTYQHLVLISTFLAVFVVCLVCEFSAAFPSLCIRKEIVTEDTHPTVFSSYVIPIAVYFGLHAAITAFK